MEEDAGKSLHEGFPDSDRKTYLDFNRSGTPLIEIVTEPDLRSAGDAADAFRKLREILIALGVNDGNMEEGSLRCDANVSVRPEGRDDARDEDRSEEHQLVPLSREGARVRDRAAGGGASSGGGTIVQETRLWDASARETFSMRSKEDAHDYRYFPEPDLPPVRLARDRIEQIRESIVELPEARRRRVMVAYALSEAEVTALENTELTPLFEETAQSVGPPARGVQLGVGRSGAQAERAWRAVRSAAGDGGRAGGVDCARRESAPSARRSARACSRRCTTPAARADDIVAADGLAQIGDEGAILSSVRAVIDANQDAVAQIRNGKTGTFGFLVGQVMKATGGKANPKLVNELLRRELNI